jgi:hypothetical protein
MYAWLLYKNNYCEPEKMQPCIIPFKVFLEDPKFINDGKNKLVFSKEFLIDFENELIQFIEAIFNLNEDFTQTNDETSCDYCDYNSICCRVSK